MFSAMPRARDGSADRRAPRSEPRVGGRQHSPERFEVNQHSPRFREVGGSDPAGSPYHGGEPALVSRSIEEWLQHLEDLCEDYQRALVGMRRELYGSDIRRQEPPRQRVDFDLSAERMRDQQGLDRHVEVDEIEVRLEGMSPQSPRPLPMNEDHGGPSNAYSSAVESPSARPLSLTTHDGTSSLVTSMSQRSAPGHVVVRSRTNFIRDQPVPKRAFVVNLRRLMSSLEVLEILHEFVKNTAIAAFTLVAASTMTQLRNTTMFLLGVFFLYTEHEKCHDYLDIRDFKILVRHYPGEPTADNPNQVLKALETRTRWGGPLVKILLHFVVLCMLAFTWYNSTAWYDAQCNDDDCENVDMQRIVVTEEDDLEFASMQVIVLSVMYIFCCLFNAIHFYEMGWYMPTRKDGKVWDVRTRGSPKRFMLFGYPSMWFSNKQAKDDMREWVDALRPNTKVYQIFPEELGMLAIDEDEDMRKLVIANLKHARYYDSKNSKTGRCEDRALDIDLCYFTDDYHSKEMKYPGSFMSPALSEYDQSNFDSFKSLIRM